MEALSYRRFFKSLLPFLFFSLIAAPSSAGQEDTPVDTGILKGGITANPQTTYTFLGWDQLGKGLGLKDEWGVRLGGFMILEPNWIASGGGDPNSVHASTPFHKFC